MPRANIDFSIASLVMRQSANWAQQERENGQSIVGAVFRHLDKADKMRLPQRQAFEAHLWMKFVGDNQIIADIINAGHLTDRALAEEYGHSGSLESYSPAQQFLIAFAKAHNLAQVERNINDNLLRGDWHAEVRKMFGGFPYPNRVFSLPMGAGKTYLMAAMIYADLHFSRLLPDDKRFAHNFVVLAPHASKTAILPSLKTIRDFDPHWILPSADAEAIKREIHLEILDSPDAAKRSTRVNNPNLEKVNRLAQTRARGLVFITNAEKVVLERRAANAPLLKGDANTLPNELCERMTDIPALAVYLDEAHHSASDDKKLRQAVGILANGGNLREANGFSGTPFAKNKIEVCGQQVRTGRILDVVYDFPLAQGIGVFLKTPKVVGHHEPREEAFIHKALDDFFGGYDKQYADDTKSKIAFYCPSIAALNEEILPAVKAWYSRHRPQQQNEIFAYYAKGGDAKKYPLPPDALSKFHSLDTPNSDKRVVLLVAVGKEGWDCRSLTAVALPRKNTTTNFVLQTTCRCLREVTKAKDETALIYLGGGNYSLLAEQLKTMHNLTVDQLQRGDVNSVPVVVRKSKLGELKWKNVWYLTVETDKEGESVHEQLQKFNTRAFFKRWAHGAADITTSTINKRGQLAEQRTASDAATRQSGGFFRLNHFGDFLTDLQQALWGLHTAAELESEHGEQLTRIYQQFARKRDWFAAHPEDGDYVWRQAVNAVADCFADERQYRREKMSEDAKIELLEWDGENTITRGGGIFIPHIAKDDMRKMYLRQHRLAEDLDDEGIDPRDLSFNYLPYRFDSDFEKNAIVEMLKESMLADFELYYNGITHGNLQSFSILTPLGKYTPDFLLIKRDGKPYRLDQPSNAAIKKVLIIETKGAPYYDDDFRGKEDFVRDTFVYENPHFDYAVFVDKNGASDFEPQLSELREKVTQWQHKAL